MSFEDAIRVILNYNTKLSQSCSRALVNAAIKGYFDIVLLLLDFGVNPNKIDKITGTGPQHEAVRYNDTNEQSREIRLKIVQYLAMYGADPELQNTQGETPMMLALLKPLNTVDGYTNSLKAFYKTPHKMPKFINPNASTLNELISTPNYPLLRPRKNWTRNDFRFCSQGSPGTPTIHPVTNLIDGNLHTMWVVSGNKYMWVVFDLKADHVITKIRMYAWMSKEMPAECFFQASNSLE